MNNNNFFNISEFAKIAGVTRQTLIYYDKIGLFHPTYIEENGYRVYSRSQINLIGIITIMTYLGIPLNEIKEIVKSVSPEATESVLKKQLSIVTQKIDKLTELKKMTELRLEQIEKGKSVKPNMPDFHVEEIKTDVPFYCGKKINRFQDELNDDVVTDFFDQVEKTGIPMIFAFCNIKDFESVIDGRENVVEQMGFRLKDKKYANRFMPSGKYLVGYAKGDYGKTNYVYKQLLAYAHDNNFTPFGKVYEEYLIDELAEKNPDEFVLQVSVRIE